MPLHMLILCKYEMMENLDKRNFVLQLIMVLQSGVYDIEEYAKFVYVMNLDIGSFGDQKLHDVLDQLGGMGAGEVGEFYIDKETIINILSSFL